MASNTAPVGGNVTVRCDADMISAEGAITCMFDEYSHTMARAADGTPYGTESYAVGFVDGTFVHTKSLDLAKLNKLRGATITVVLASGRSGTLREALLVSASEVDSSKGTVKLRWEGVGAWDPNPA